MQRAASLAIAAAGILAGMIVATRTRSLREGIRVALDLWTAAGLLKLAADASWSAIAVAAIVVALRHLISASFFQPHALR
jgi:hypothetical protein